MKVLLATDGSKYAKAAVKKCCEFIPANDDTRVRIVSIAETLTPIATDPIGISNEFYTGTNKELEKAAKNFVSEAKEIVEEKLGDEVEVETGVIKGFPKEAIVDEAKSWGADLIVVGSHGYGFWERMLIGSVSDAVIHHAPCSVLVVRGAVTED